MNTENPLESAVRCVAFHVRDWSEEKRDAWLYGIICGWDDESLSELRGKHGWTENAVSRLKRLRVRWEELEKQETSK